MLNDSVVMSACQQNVDSFSKYLPCDMEQSSELGLQSVVFSDDSRPDFCSRSETCFINSRQVALPYDAKTALQQSSRT